jgi:hypothetical protein
VPAIVAAVVMAAMAPSWFSTPQRSGTSGVDAPTGSASGAGSASVSGSESSADDWEAAAREIEALRSDVDDLDRRAAQLWDEALSSP